MKGKIIKFGYRAIKETDFGDPHGDVYFNIEATKRGGVYTMYFKNRSWEEHVRIYDRFLECFNIGRNYDLYGQQVDFETERPGSKTIKRLFANGNEIVAIPFEKGHGLE